MLPKGEWFWRTLYGLAEMDPLYDRNIMRIARAVLGPQAVRLVTAGEYELTCDAALLTDPQGRQFIGVRASVDAGRRRCLVAHELCEHRCTALGYRRPDREVVCNVQARALLAPEPALIAVAAMLDERAGLRELSAAFGMAEIQMALRLGETPGGPSIAVRLPSGRIVVRDERRRLPEQLVLRALFACDGDAKHVLLPVSNPANGQVLMRTAED